MTALAAFKFAMLVSLSVALAFGAYGIASAPSRPANRLGLRGLRRQKLLKAGGPWSMVEPLVRWLGLRLSGVIPNWPRERLEAQLTYAGDYLGMTAEEFIALTMVSATGGLLVGTGAHYAFGVSPLFGMFTTLAGLLVPYLQVSAAAQDRGKRIARGLPYAVDMMSLAMTAGADFVGSIRNVVDKSSNPEDPLVEEIALILQSLQLGRTRKDALAEFARRAPVESVKEFTSSLIQAEERGNPVAEVLIIQATSSRLRRSERAEQLAAKAGVAMVGPLALMFISVLGLVIAPILLKLL